MTAQTLGGGAPRPAVVSKAEALRVWAKIGLLSFGGPAGQIALMHRIIVDEKRWIADASFLHALNFCMILPGPEAQQLATYIGWRLHGVRGGLVAGSLFILPGFLVILALSYLYVTAADLPVVQGLFLGLKTAVIAIVIQAVLRIGRKSLTQPALRWLAVFAFVAMFVFKLPFPLVIAMAALYGLLQIRGATVGHGSAVAGDGHAPAAESATDVTTAPDRSAGYAVRTSLIFLLLWLAPVAAIVGLLGPQSLWAEIGVFFSKMAVVTFGGAYAVLAYVAQEAVQAKAWLLPSEMLDGLAMAETTPGPLILVVQFVGFMAAYRNPGTLPPGLAGLLGSALTVWVTFVPCFLWIFLGAPHMERLRQNSKLSGAFSAVTASVVGVIANLAVWFTMHTLFAKVATVGSHGVAMQLPIVSSIQWAPLAIALVALLLVFGRRASIPLTLAVTGGLGMATHLI